MLSPVAFIENNIHGFDNEDIWDIVWLTEPLYMEVIQFFCF